MKVVFTEDALRDLDEILRFIGRNYPTISLAFEKRLHTLLERPVRNYLIVYEVGRDEARGGARGKRNDKAPGMTSRNALRAWQERPRGVVSARSHTISFAALSS
jgi:plasmid stabilization system protein ParE